MRKLHAFHRNERFPLRLARRKPTTSRYNAFYCAGAFRNTGLIVRLPWRMSFGDTEGQQPTAALLWHAVYQEHRIKMLNHVEAGKARLHALWSGRQYCENLACRGAQCSHTTATITNHWSSQPVMEISISFSRHQLVGRKEENVPQVVSVSPLHLSSRCPLPPWPLRLVNADL